MNQPTFARLENLKTPEEPAQPVFPRNVRAKELLEMAYRGEVTLTSQQMRAAIESLPYESPKVPTRAEVQVDFAIKLDRAIERTQRVINAQVIEHRQTEVDGQ